MVHAVASPGRTRARLGAVMVAAGLVASLLVACADDSDSGESGSVVWRWEHALSLPGTNYEQLATQELPQMLSEATGGRVTLEVVIGQTSPEESLHAIAQGRFDGGTVMSAYYSAENALWDLGGIPFLFKDFEEYAAETEAVDDQITATLEEATGVLNPGGGWTMLPNAIFTNEQRLEEIADWEGQRLRVSGAERARLVESFGGAPTQMPFADVYSALERGALDGFVTTLGAASSGKFWEVTGYVNLWPIGSSMARTIVNPDSLDELDPQLRDAVVATLEEFAANARKAQLAATGDLIRELESQGMEAVYPSAAAITAGAQVRDEEVANWLERVPEADRQIALDVLDTIGVAAR